MTDPPSTDPPSADPRRGRRPAPDRVLLAAGTGTYDSGEFKKLDKVPDSLRAVVAAAGKLGIPPFVDGPGYQLDPDSATLSEQVAGAVHAESQVIIIYYTGHGEKPDADSYYLLTRDSTRRLPKRLAGSAVRASDLVGMVVRRDADGGLAADQPSVLVVLDCCYSGAGGMDSLREALQGVGNGRTWWIASAGPVEWAQQGAFATALAQALDRPMTGPSQRFLGLETVLQSINNTLDARRGDQAANGAPRDDQQARWWPPAKGSTGLPPFFPNPDFVPDVAGLTLDEQHWRSRLQAGDTTTSGFYFTGRTGRVRATADLASWLTGTGGGLAVVTGSPGSGKSALLALPVFLTRPGRRAELLRDAEPGSLLATAADLVPPALQVIAVHARGLNADQVAAAVNAALHRPGRGATALMEDLILSGPPPGLTLIIDAVDEAVDPTGMLTRLLVPLARTGLGVLLGTRRHLLRPIDGASGTAGAAELTIDLDDEDYRDPEALIHYVRQLLTAAKEPGIATPYQPTDPAAGAVDPVAEEVTNEVTSEVARVIAARATATGGAESFLVARLLALSVRGRPTIVDITDQQWQSQLPDTVGAAFGQDLSRRLGDRLTTGRALLAALAWAHGPGMPWETLWVPVARALTNTRNAALHTNRTDETRGVGAVDDEDVRWLLGAASAYIVEDLGPGGRSVFRLVHDLLSTYLRNEPSRELLDTDPDVSADWRQRRRSHETAISRALLATVPPGPPRQWSTAHPYLLTYLAEHAAAADPGTLAELAADPGFLAVADPTTLIPLLLPTDPLLRDAARVYRRAAPLLGTDPAANLAYLLEAATALDVPAVISVPTELFPPYRTALAVTRHDDSLLTLVGHTSSVRSVAFGAGADMRLLLASGGEDGTVRLWDPVSGAPVGQPLTGHTGYTFGVASVAFGAGGDGRLLLASGGEDGRVRVWDPVTGSRVGEPLTGHTSYTRVAASVAFGAGADGRLLLASAGEDGTVWVWDPVTGVPVGQPLTGHTRAVMSVAFGAGADGRLLLASAGWEARVRVWDPMTGVPVGQPLTGHTRAVMSVAFGAGADGRLLLATASEDGTVRVWDPVTGSPVGQPLTGHTGHTGPVASVAFGAGADGPLLLASAGGDGTVWVWDPVTGVPVGQPLTGHTGPVASVAFGAGADGRLLLASAGGDGTVRVWDPVTGVPVTGHTDWMRSVAFGAGAYGRPLLAFVRGLKRIRRVWDSATGARVGESLTGQTDRLRSVAFGASGDGRLLLASAGEDGTVWVWDLVTGVPVGQPLTGHAFGVASVAFGAGGDGLLLLASAGEDGTVRMWDLVTGVPVGQPLTGNGYTRGVASVAFGAGGDGRLLLASASGGDRRVRVWDPVTGSPVGQPLTGHTGYTRVVASVAFGAGADGRLLLASAGGDGTVRVWDPVTGVPVGQPLTGHTRAVTSVAFGAGADGRLLLASAGEDGRVWVWDPVTGSPVGQPLTGHTGHIGPVASVAFGAGADGRLLLASAGQDRTVRLWDLSRRTLSLVIHRRTEVRAVALARSGTIAIGDDEGLTVITVPPHRT